MVTVVGDLATLVAVSIMMLLINWRLALVAFAVLPFMAGVDQRFSGVRCAKPSATFRAAVAKLNSYLQEQLSGVSGWCSCSIGSAPVPTVSRR